MKDVFINEKLYHQMEDVDLDKLPKQEHDKDLLKKYNYDALMEKLKKI